MVAAGIESPACLLRSTPVRSREAPGRETGDVRTNATTVKIFLQRPAGGDAPLQSYPRRADDDRGSHALSTDVAGWVKFHSGDAGPV
jgi:hypothetical protein